MTFRFNNNNNNNAIMPVPWQSGRSLVWDVTVVCPLADSYVASAFREASSVAELAASKKMDKYTGNGLSLPADCGRDARSD